MAKKKKIIRKKRESKTIWWWKYIRSRARQVMKWSPEKRRVIAEAKGFCPGCKKHVESLDADHIDPVQPVDQTFIGDWNTYFDRMFNGKMQPLCPACHDLKTQIENKLRKQYRDQKRLKNFVPKEDNSSKEQ